MANEITFDKLPQAVGYLTEQVERIHKIVAALQPQSAINKHRIAEIACLSPENSFVLQGNFATH